MYQTTTAKQMAEEGSYSEDVYQAYIDDVGEKYTTREIVEEAYAGEFESDVEFALRTAEETQFMETNKSIQWPYSCIDWEHAARELMYDYFESDGYYFRNL